MMKYLLILLFSSNLFADATIMVDRYILESEATPTIGCPLTESTVKTKDECEAVDDPGVDDCVSIPIAPCELLELDDDTNFPSIAIRADLLYPGGPGSPTLPTITSSDFPKIMSTADFGSAGQLLQTTGVPHTQGFTPYAFPDTQPTTGQILEATSSATLTFVDHFVAGNETSFWIGPSSGVSGGNDVPIFTATPTRTNTFLGSSADITNRISDTQLEIVNDGLHSVSITLESSGSSDELEIKINGAIWLIGKFGALTGTFDYDFTAGDDITVTRQGGGNRIMSDITVSVKRLGE